jgi:hypothetical protein
MDGVFASPEGGHSIRRPWDKEDVILPFKEPGF